MNGWEDGYLSFTCGLEFAKVELDCEQSPFCSKIPVERENSERDIRAAARRSRSLFSHSTRILEQKRDCSQSKVGQNWPEKLSTSKIFRTIKKSPTIPEESAKLPDQ